MKTGDFVRVRTQKSSYAGMIVQQEPGNLLIRSPWGITHDTADIWVKEGDCTQIEMVEALEELHKYTQKMLRVTWDLSQLAHRWLEGSPDRFSIGRNPGQ